jgi:hypothetical protein
MADSTDALSSPTATATKGKNELKILIIKLSKLEFHILIGTKREAELDDVSPSKLKALKASNGTNGEAPTVVDDDSSNHKNGDYHDEEDDDDDVSCRKQYLFSKKKIFFSFSLSGSWWRPRRWRL